MTERSRFAVPLDALEQVQVDVAEQVEAAVTAAHPDTASWTGSLTPAYGDGGTSGHDGDGD